METVRGSDIHEYISKFLQEMEYSLLNEDNTEYYLINFETQEEVSKYISPTIDSTSPFPVRGSPKVKVGKWIIVRETTNQYNYHHRYDEDFIFLLDPDEIAIKQYNSIVDELERLQRKKTRCSLEHRDLNKFLETLSDPT
jgi:hypothetical protein